MSQNSQNRMIPEILDGIADGVVLQHHIQHRRAFGLIPADCWGHVPQPFGGCPQ